MDGVIKGTVDSGQRRQAVFDFYTGPAGFQRINDEYQVAILSDVALPSVPSVGTLDGEEFVVVSAKVEAPFLTLVVQKKEIQ
jgi:hypothetical protein